MKFPHVLFASLVLVLVSAACAQTDPTEILIQAETAVVPTDTAAAEEAPTEIPATIATEAPTDPVQAELPDASEYGWVSIVNGLAKPDYVTHAGDGSGRLFILEQDGRIRIAENGTLLEEPFLDITGKVGSEGNEQGLLGLAFHPNYEQNGAFFLNYTDTAGDTVIARYQVSADANLADAGSEQVLLQVHQPYGNHNGGGVEFGPDGMLYLGLGDGGSQGDPAGNAQSLDSLLGKILRIDVDGGNPYGIPADNPFANGEGLGEIWAYGLRNPWRFSFDAATGDIYIADVGQNEWEEVSMLPEGMGGGSNLGWNYFEGTHDYQGQTPEGINLIEPVAEYDHSGRCSITGGYVYRGASLAAWQGIYLYGDFCSGEVFGLVRTADGGWQDQILFWTGFLITSFGVDEAGEIYLVARDGTIYQLQAQ